MNILHIQAGTFGNQSVSRQLSDKIASRLAQQRLVAASVLPLP